jgi:hypothetical protein
VTGFLAPTPTETGVVTMLIVLGTAAYLLTCGLPVSGGSKPGAPDEMRWRKAAVRKSAKADQVSAARTQFSRK